MKFTYRIEGMHCSACIEKIKLALSPLSFNLLEVTLNPPALKIEAEHTPSINDRS
jgi:copper chaperone CopZ